MGAQAISILHFLACRQDTELVQNLKCYALWMKLSDALNLKKLCPIYGAHNTINIKDRNWLESKIPVAIFATCHKKNTKVEIHQACCNSIKIELVLSRDYSAMTNMILEHLHNSIANAIHIGTGVFTEDLVRWIDRDYPRSPFTILDTSIANEELESTIALLFSMQKPKSFEMLRKFFFWNSHSVEPLLHDEKITLHEMRVALTGNKKKTEKCLAKPKLLRRSNPADNLVPTQGFFDFLRVKYSKRLTKSIYSHNTAKIINEVTTINADENNTEEN